MVERPLHPREYLLIPVAIAIGVVLVYDVPFFGLPISAVILGRFLLAGADSLALTTVATAGLASALLGVTRPIMVVPALGATVWASRALSRHEAWRVFAVLTIVVFLSYGVAFSAGSLIQGESPGSAVAAQVDEALAQMDAVFAGPRTDATARSVYADVRETARVSLVAIWPGANLLSAMLAAALATQWLARLAAAHGIRTRGPRPFVDLDLSWHVVWPLIAGLALAAWALYTDSEASPVAGVGFNLLLVSGAVVCVQGLAVAEAMLRRLRLGVLLRLALYGGLFWLNVLFPMLAVAGAVDLWANFRKIPRGPDRLMMTVGDDSDGGVE